MGVQKFSDADGSRRETQDQERNQMGIELILGVVVFVALFGLWVVLPSKLRKDRD